MSQAEERQDFSAKPGSVGTFTEGGVGKHLLKLGSFMAMGTITINIAQVAEAIFLGMLGTEALAAIGFAFPITITLFAFAGGIGSGASSVIARAMGRGDKKRAAILVTHAQILTILLGLVLGFFGITYSAEIVAGLGAKDRVLELTIEYLEVYMLGFPFFMLSMVGSTLLRATGRAASPGIIMSVGSLLQILLAPLLIFGWDLLGVRALGFAGAAWAYFASQTLGILRYVWML